jgi:UDP-glucuronate decarboxylase
MHPKNGRVDTNFIMQAIQGDNLTIYGNAQQTRSFCYCYALTEGMVRPMVSQSTDIFLPMNIGSLFGFAILDFAKMIISFYGGTSIFSFGPLPAVDPKQEQPNISKAYTKIDWSQTIQFAGDFQHTIEYFKEGSK